MTNNTEIIWYSHGPRTILEIWADDCPAPHYAIWGYIAFPSKDHQITPAITIASVLETTIQAKLQQRST